MQKTLKPAAAAEEIPLISNGFLLKLTAVIGVLALLSAVINVTGHRIGAELARGGHSDSTDILSVTIGQDTLRLTENTLRFEDQRHDGRAEQADLYFLWPEMTGYHPQYSRRFNDITQADTLIFVQLSQSTMSRDMSGRLEPIYSHFFDGPPRKGPHGLTLHRLKAKTGYENEVILSAPRLGQADYAVRCLLPDPGAPPSSGDCQRDIHLGRDLTVLYRFSSALLGDWDRIDMAVRAYFEARLVAAPQK